MSTPHVWKRRSQKWLGLLLGCGAIALGASFADVGTVTPPAIWWCHPLAGRPGTRVAILGRGLSQASLVTFGGVQAPFTRVGPMAIRATVPPGALRGPISVTTPLGTACSRAAFRARFRPGETAGPGYALAPEARRPFPLSGRTPHRKAAMPVTS